MSDSYVPSNILINSGFELQFCTFCFCTPSILNELPWWITEFTLGYTSIFIVWKFWAKTTIFFNFHFFDTISFRALGFLSSFYEWKKLYSIDQDFLIRVHLSLSVIFRNVLRFIPERYKFYLLIQVKTNGCELNFSSITLRWYILWFLKVRFAIFKVSSGSSRSPLFFNHTLENLMPNTLSRISVTNFLIYFSKCCDSPHRLIINLHSGGLNENISKY